MMKEVLLNNPRLNVLVSVLIRLIILVVGLFGNGLVVLAVWKKRTLRTTTNLLLLNLAISDLTTQVFCTLMFIPEFTTLGHRPWSDIFCILFVSTNVPLTTTFVSILTLTVLAVERYHAVVKPMRSEIRLREDTVKYACLAVWLAGIILALPLYIFGRYDEESGRCLHGWKDGVFGYQSYRIFLAVIIVLLPFLIISFCYGQILHDLYFKNKVGPQNIALQQETREKRKLFKISMTVTGVFALFLFPYAIFNGLRDDTGNLWSRVARLVFFSQSGFNPLIYSFQSTNFRQAFKEIFVCRAC
ncbi:QRFP-like peptide receptor [Actinia tenebrosa]|uniref:QRFP-like peptide receptor n=1 Tax=Actinia tenebrosa TaxID=6105 RepID=A0A6P8J1F8_ACTTE|nr:QRFP-like peptide receptor [Actinia tenebrosa]